jgi:hypothetical protein
MFLKFLKFQETSFGDACIASFIGGVQGQRPCAETEIFSKNLDKKGKISYNKLRGCEEYILRDCARLNLADWGR